MYLAILLCFTDTVICTFLKGYFIPEYNSSFQKMFNQIMTVIGNYLAPVPVLESSDFIEYI